MRIISHRGNINGPIINQENKPEYIDKAISLGFDVEVDIRYIDGKFWLGHDTNDYDITINWLIDRKDKLWLHCKDLYSVYELSKIDASINKFCHSSDPYTLISNGGIWVHNINLKLNDTCIIPLINLKDICTYKKEEKIYGICTDYPIRIKNNEQYDTLA